MVADLFKDAVFSSINYTNQKSTFTECLFGKAGSCSGSLQPQPNCQETKKINR